MTILAGWLVHESRIWLLISVQDLKTGTGWIECLGPDQSSLNGQLSWYISSVLDLIFDLSSRIGA